MAVENPVFRLFPVFVFFTCYGIIVERIASGYTGLLLDCGCLWIYGYYNSLVFFFFFFRGFFDTIDQQDQRVWCNEVFCKR